MPEIQILKDKNIVQITIGEKLSHEDIDRFRVTLDDYINEGDIIPNLVLLGSDRPHWQNLKAFREHLKLIRDYQKLIKKVAVVGDAKMLQALPPLLDHFVGAKIRHFSMRDYDDAVVWASLKDDHPGSFNLLDGFPHDVIAIEPVGEITAQDYEQMLIPLVRDKMKEHDQLKLYLQIDDAFRGFSAGALWDDARFGFSHLSTFSRAAIVTDVPWIRRSLKLFGPLWPTTLMVFHIKDAADAREWIKQ